MSDSESEVEDISSHSAALKRLKNKDPEFYSFLKDNDSKLLSFRDSDAEQEDEDLDETSTVKRRDKFLSKKLSPAYIESLKERVQSSPNIEVCKELMQVFGSVVQQADEVESVHMSNSDVFNDVIKLCLVELIPALSAVLKLTSPGSSAGVVNVAKSKAWRKLSTCIKGYLTDILKLLTAMTEPSNLTLLLKHVVHLTCYYIKSPKLSRQLLQKMILLWSSKEERVRVHALVVVYRMIKVLDKVYLKYASKNMYFSYVNNTKFTSATMWPIINFMKQSLVEIYMLDAENAYESAFVYIRQLSIHLRNAVTMKKKEAFRVVYNWQYVHSIMLWANVLSSNYENESLKSLIYPLVQTAIGTINLIQTPKHFPLRFHLVRALVKLSEKTETFLPLLPIILEPLTLVDFDKKLGFSKKPIDFMCCLKLSKSQLQESGFKDATVDQVCELLTEYFKIHCHTVGFPELALPAVVQLKAFIKKCKVAKYCQQVKQVIDKVLENSNFITEKRKLISFAKVIDDEEIHKWEEKTLEEAPLMKRYLKRKDQSVQSPRKKRKVVFRK